MLKLRLKELYKEKGVTQREVSEDLGIRQGTLSGLANNARSSWDIDILLSLLIYFEIKDIRELIEYESPLEFIEQMNNNFNLNLEKKHFIDFIRERNDLNNKDSSEYLKYYINSINYSNISKNNKND
ncbi:helix-turn-helix domain-containing protein [Bacillus sp. SG-1]|uniref:helix-turn-helix domain-containing protein n=1 Tax=Bacillus sp. SG-1 TaxID=161544 RepID=UPI0001543E90|nr:helix-turn-helix transcriptional regulator [Bacillus sp. SG-1]EDL65005.1 hypothetical protein BSG1_14829 [Bacillus sp. SG-1]